LALLITCRTPRFRSCKSLGCEKRPSLRARARIAQAGLIAAWLLLILVGLSMPEPRKARYQSPAVPAMAAVTACRFMDRGDRVLSIVYQVLEKPLPMLAA